MKALFTHVCSLCQLLKPRCARVWYWTGASALASGDCINAAALCEECRKKLTGYYVMDKQHVTRAEQLG